KHLFAEGLTVMDERLYLLTWKSGTGFLYQLPGLEEKGTFRFHPEGWGLTHAENGDFLLRDGSHILRLYRGTNFSQAEPLAVYLEVRHGQDLIRYPVSRLNELEVQGKVIYANIWGTPYIVRIGISTGLVEGIV